MIIETFRQAIQNVWSNKLRTFLTMLGIIRLEDGRVVYDGDSHAPEAVVQPTLLPEQESQTEEAQA